LAAETAIATATPRPIDERRPTIGSNKIDHALQDRTYMSTRPS
jgi:hypothetical protein